MKYKGKKERKECMYNLNNLHFYKMYQIVDPQKKTYIFHINVQPKQTFKSKKKKSKVFPLLSLRYTFSLTTRELSEHKDRFSLSSLFILSVHFTCAVFTMTVESFQSHWLL
jgi:hypothetical protein